MLIVFSDIMVIKSIPYMNLPLIYVRYLMAILSDGYWKLLSQTCSCRHDILVKELKEEKLTPILAYRALKLLKRK